MNKNPGAEPAVNKTADRQLIFIIQPDGLAIDWQNTADELSPQQQQTQHALFDDGHADLNQMIYNLAFADVTALPSASVRFISLIGHRFVQQVAMRPEREFLRERLDTGLTDVEGQHLLDQAPYMIGQENLNLSWLKQLWAKLQTGFAAEITKFAGTVAEYLSFRHAKESPVGRVYFNLVENKTSSLPFAFLATYAAGVDHNNLVNHYPLNKALIEYKHDHKKMLMLLSTVNRAAEKSSLIRELLDSGEIYQPIGLNAHEAWQFLRDIPIFEDAGILCRIPDWWKKCARSARVSVSIGAKPPNRLDRRALLDCKINLLLDDMQLSADEIRQMLHEAEGLRLIKGRWVEVDHAKLQAALQEFERIHKQTGQAGLNLIDALRLSVSSQNDLALESDDRLVEIEHGVWMQSFLMNMAGSEDCEMTSPSDTFNAKLRPYQVKGLSWLHLMKSLGLGACLADDMGLGKTVQVLALLDAVRSQRQEKTLLVVPASLIGNWKQEIQRFAPSLRYGVLHPSEKPDESQQLEDPGNYDVLITTYSMLSRHDWLKEFQWDNLILDEAQAIKNPGTRQTRLVKQLPANFKVALTGTPIENRLSDLWSLFDFINKGLLGSAGEFAKFSKLLQTQETGYARLKQMVSPFILRRLKTDKRVISDLPDKVEMKTYAGLSKKQTVLYQLLVESVARDLDTAGDGIERKGLILTTIMKLKQICNHPDHYLGQSCYKETESGKFDRLREICETIFAKRERVLVFTQFQEMTGPLQRLLEEIFDHAGLVLHGGTPVAKRRQIVEMFQGADYVPFLIMTIKAGGVGLNLTAANHVIHFDRWWNPAVENQATDRAFRIGQQKNVLVHKFITSGTIEEKIDQIIEDKRSLAQDIVPDQQEAWITELDNRQLMDLFKLTV